MWLKRGGRLCGGCAERLVPLAPISSFGAYLLFGRFVNFALVWASLLIKGLGLDGELPQQTLNNL